MENDLKDIKGKIDAIYGILLSYRSNSHRENELEKAVKKAIDDLERTKSSFKSKQLMLIKEDLIKALKEK
jgi:hypothetical protein